MQNSDLDGTGITLQLSPDGVLTADYLPANRTRPLDRDQLLHAVEAFGGLLVPDEVLDELIRRCAVEPISFNYRLGERRDGSLEIDISEDLMAATVTIKPSYGGKGVSVEDVQRALAEQGVVYGIMAEAIEAAVAAGSVVDHLVAAGAPPQPGLDSQFISLIPEVTTQAPQLSDNDTADYRNLGDIVSVSLGDPLMRREPATAGIPGHNLLGQELPTTDGLDIPFAEHLSGIACDLRDRELLVAAISGLPVPVPHGMNVEPVFKVKRVDLSTGNLRFKGTVEVAGDVTEGMEVTATEDVRVGGIVEAARVQAGGDILVMGGVIGHGEVALNKKGNKRETAQLEAGGSITVQFAENAMITAIGDITVKELSMQSELTSGSCIMVGEKGGRKGHIIGGFCRATTLVNAVVLGSRVGVLTVVEVGVDPALNKKMEIVKDAIAEKTRLMEELTKTLTYVKENPGKMEPTLIALKERVFAKYQGEIAELSGEKKRLQKRMEINALAKVVVERDAFLGTQIRIGERALQIEEDLTSPTFALGENGIIF
jgi:uncharacterized protein (DUF342 family)